MKALKLLTLAVVGAALAGAILYWLNYERWVKIPQAEQLIASQLRDPASTQFRDTRLTAAGWLCGELNSKNGSGGYVGFKKFVSGGKAGTYYIEDHGSVGEETTGQLIERLDQSIKVQQVHNKLRETNPDIGPLSDSRREEMASANVFANKWAEICE